MAGGIFRVDDGSTWYFDADSHEHARELWKRACVEICGDPREEENLEITRVQLVDASGITVVSDDWDAPCSRCGTPNKESTKTPLLDVWREEQKKPVVERAKCGVLCNSEWP